MRAAPHPASRVWRAPSSIASSLPSRAISRAARGKPATARSTPSQTTTSVSASSLRGGRRRLTRLLVLAHLRHELALHRVEELRPLLLRDVVHVVAPERHHALAALLVRAHLAVEVAVADVDHVRLRVALSL